MTALYAFTAAVLSLGAVALATVRAPAAARVLAGALAVDAYLVGRNLLWDAPGFEWLSAPPVLWASAVLFMVPPILVSIAVRWAKAGGADVADLAMHLAVPTVWAIGLVALDAVMGDTEEVGRYVGTWMLTAAVSWGYLRDAVSRVRTLPSAARRSVAWVVGVFCIHVALSLSAWGLALLGGTLVPAEVADAAGPWLEGASVAALLAFGVGAAALGLRRVASDAFPDAEPSTALTQASVADPRDAALADALAAALDAERLFLDPDLTLPALARHVRATPRDVSRILVAEFGGFRRAVTSRRVAAAQRILEREPDAAVLDVLHRAGFGSTSAFHRAFKAHAGMSPAAYRERWTALGAVPLPATGRAGADEAAD